MTYALNLELIKEKRIKANLSMGDMAKYLGLTGKADYFRREHGITRFRSTELPILAKLLDVKIDDFFTPKV